MLLYLTHALGPAAQATLATWLDPISHPATTTRLVTLALAKQDLALALMLAERRCRLTTPSDAIDHVLRAELLNRSGDRDAARADILRGLDIAPDDIFANRKQLQWAAPADAAIAAARLLEFDRDPTITASAVATLGKSGITAIARASVIDGAIRGWAAWRPPAGATGAADTGQTLIVSHDRTTDRVRLSPDPKHPMAGVLGAANSFAVASKIGPGQWLATRSDAGPLHLPRMFTGFAGTSAGEPTKANATLKRRRGTRAKSPRPQVTVIVPVHGDLDATRACLDSLLRSMADESLRIRILVVNDASPEAGMAAYLAGLPVDLLTCAVNLGFVGAVNAALEHAADGDIVLLNADTVLPDGVIGRLHATAHASDDIGTVTPLSNNGELTSFPVAFRDNPLPDAALIARIDAAAAGIDAAPVDLPTGIGFCLYVKRACLAAVGGLSAHYERGYGEDVHLCLAAREAGFRSVCATSIYIGHAGTRSFLASKRALVMRNAARVAARFPDHEHEVAAFVAADPLSATRHAMGRRLIADFTGPVVVAARGSLPPAEALMSALGKAGRPALLATFDRDVATWRLHDAGGASAAETAFVLPNEAADLAACRATLRATAIDVLSPEAFTAMGFDGLDCPFDLHLADLGGGDRRATPVAGKGRAKAWRPAVKAARRLIAPAPAAHALALALWPSAADRLTTAVAPSRPACRMAPADNRRLGVALLDETHLCRRFVRTLAAHLPRGQDGEPRLVVIGATADDLGLLRAGGLMIIGAAMPGEIAPLAHRLRLSHMLAVSSGPNFGTPAGNALTGLDLPLAQFDWTRPTRATAPPDLWLSPDDDDEALAEQLAIWLMEAGPAP